MSMVNLRPRLRLRFRLKTNTFRPVLAFHPILKRSKTKRIDSKTLSKVETSENAGISFYCGRSKMEPFEDALVQTDLRIHLIVKRCLGLFHSKRFHRLDVRFKNRENRLRNISGYSSTQVGAYQATWFFFFFFFLLVGNEIKFSIDMQGH